MELSESLSHLLPELTLNNIVGFVRVYDEIRPDKKGYVIDSMQYLKGPEAYKIFNSKLDAIEGERKKPAQELKRDTWEFIQK